MCSTSSSQISDIEDIFTQQLQKESKREVIIDGNNRQLLENIIIQYCGENISTNFELYIKKAIRELKKKKLTFSEQHNKNQLLYIYNSLVLDKRIPRTKSIEDHCVRGGVRENSGVLVVTLVMSPYPEDPTRGEEEPKRKSEFTCKHNCYYCPDYPDMPRSYIPDEPAVARAIQNDWDPIKQFLCRVITYKQNGMNFSGGIKAEVILEGGTFNSYPKAYRQDFIHKIFYVANMITYDNLDISTLDQNCFRKMLPIDEEHRINESAFCKIVGLSIETRPDEITPKFIIEMRTFGVTRVQIGVQHVDDKILRKINRGCYLADTIRAFDILVSCAFKVAIHLMPDLPNSSYEIDREMFKMILENHDISPDYLKIYPTAVTPHTVIEKWFKSGLYIPYGETVMEDPNDPTNMINPLIPLLSEFMKNISEWIRVERVFRDIPLKTVDTKEVIIMGGCKTTNLRQEVQKYMDKHNFFCKDIRNREVKDGLVPDNIEIVVREYYRLRGREFFISFENLSRTVIYGFCRLRLPDKDRPGYLKELAGSALIRELHVYGKMNSVGSSHNEKSAQHRGLGTLLLRHAEDIAISNGYLTCSVISAVGTKGYYRKKGYTEEGLYQTKILQTQVTPTRQIASSTFDHTKILIQLLVLIFAVIFHFSFFYIISSSLNFF